MPRRPVLLVAAGGAAGGPARYAVETWLTTDGGVPWGTLCVNVVGAFALGVVLGRSRPSPGVVALVGTGFLGSFTTFSAWMLQVLLLADTRHATLAAGYLAGTLAAGLTAAVAGGWLARRGPAPCG